MNISSEGGIEKYLGLPEHFAREKRDTFAKIMDRIRQRSHGWTARYLSSAGKRVLLKAILALMPTYAMLQAPKIFVQANSIGSHPLLVGHKTGCEENMLGRLGKVTPQKCDGGLGFKYIEVFNDALLAKLAWRLLKNMSSLLGRTL